MMTLPGIGRVLKKAEAARLLGVAVRTLENYVYQQGLPRVKRGGRFFFRPDDLRAFVQTETTTPEEAAPPRVDNAASVADLRRRGYQVP